MHKAESLAGEGRIAESLELMRTLRATEQLPASYFRLRGTLETRSRQFEEAERDLSGALARDPENADTLYTLGLVLLQRGNSSGTRDTLRHATQLAPAHAESWLALGEAYSQLKDQLQLEASIRKALELSDNSAVICFGAGTIYQGAGQFASAARLFGDAVRKAPMHPIARALYVQNLIRAQQEKRALKLAEEWRSNGGVSPRQHLEIGVTFAAANFFSGAIQEFQEALSKDPLMIDAKYNLALAFLFEGDYTRSEALARDLTPDRDGDQTQCLLGLIKEEQGDIHGARTYFSRAAEINPQSTEAFFHLGRIDLQLLNLKEAKSEFKESDSLCRDRCAAPLIGLGTAYKLEGNFDGSVTIFREAIRRRPSEAVGYLYLGDILIRERSYGEAANILLKANQLDPRSSLGQYMYAYALLKSDSGTLPAPVIPALEAAIRLEPDNGLAYFRLGTIYFQRKDYPRAEGLLRTAVRLQPELKEAHLQYAAALEKLNRRKLATREFEQVRKMRTMQAEEEARMMQEMRRISSN